jgi:eukaryotic-like serine/threonine-protein kinase
LIGSVLDKYELLQKIGEGGMATVYRGRHTTLGRDVAIKVLHPHLSRSQRNRRRFAREARAIENLDHDNILKIFDYSGTEAEDCYIVTEFVDGATLQLFVSERGRIPSEVTAIIGARLAEALGYAHTLGIIHRDLKPENVMIRRDGAVKLMDFGIARFLDEVNLTVTGALVGSPAYMSPEQAMERVLDPRSDLFSIGTLLYHLLTGQLPFSGSNPSIILRNIIEGKRPEITELAPDISGTLADTVERLLQTSPDDRPIDCNAVSHSLLQSLAEVHIDPDEPKWQLRSWLEDPDAYEERLNAHLGRVLLDEGQARLDEGDHLGALRLFNRLLSIDEDNEEVMALVQGMHVPSSSVERRPLRIAGGLVGIVAAALFTWVLWPSPPPPAPKAPLVVAPETVPLEVPYVMPEVVAAAPVVLPTPPVASPPLATRGSKAGSRRGSVGKASPRARILPESELRAPPTPATGKVVVAVEGGSWGDILIDGKPSGRTGRGAIDVLPGKHRLQVRNTAAMPHFEDFEVAAGERKEIVVSALIPKRVVRFLDALDRDCVVVLDGQAAGRIGELGGRLDVPQAGRRHVVELGCKGLAPRKVDVPAGPAGSTVEIGP